MKSESNATELLNSLKQTQKSIPSKFFYDDRGSQLFAQITELEEYYPTKCEDQILQDHAREMLQSLHTKELVLMELGAGDGRKTRHLLTAAQSLDMKVTYIPIDISMEALKLLCSRLSEFNDDIRITPRILDLETQSLPREGEVPHLIAYLGSTIGNSEPESQVQFLRRLHMQTRDGDFILIGFDLEKDRETLLAAYDDEAGVTREFNMNLLSRMNREFQASFDQKKWLHRACFNAETGAMESYLVSRCNQVVSIAGTIVHFSENEAIQTEVSWKFSKNETRALAKAAGFKVVREWQCNRDWFMDSLWKRAINEQPFSLNS
jgi:L-histidine Nalpha-methyltransferase